jgi:SpoVK/Ycf46/Vps4 family AAA+-type ATPase
MSDSDRLFVEGIPEGVPEREAAILTSRLLTFAEELRRLGGSHRLLLRVGTPSALRAGREVADPEAAERPAYAASEPKLSFDQLVLPREVLDALLLAADSLRLETRVFDEWGLRKIEPCPRSALNLHGPPGTGKTLAAHALAHHLGRPILVASYAEIESKYHGDGPKNVKALFQAAEEQRALLFIDEADSLLSKRLTNVTQGSEQAINSMRSQLLICLEQFHGIVVFATNLVENYDKAFETRVRHIELPLPDLDARREIWRGKLIPELPLAEPADLDALAAIDDVCGREIKDAVIQAANRAACEGRIPAPADLVAELERIKAARIASPRPLAGAEARQVGAKVRSALGGRDQPARYREHRPALARTRLVRSG